MRRNRPLRVVVTPPAQRDLREIARWLMEERPGTVDKLLTGIENAAAKIGETPYAFQIVSRYADHALRRRVYRRYLILYRVTDRVEIIRIIHGARDYEALLRPEGD